MTNEELENSLRTEVDNYFKSAFADMQQEVEKLHDALNSEFERHRSQIEEQFRTVLAREISDVKIDDSFETIVAEHIRIAREEGANEASEKFAAIEPPAPVTIETTNYAAMRDAVGDISNQSSQAEILKALVRHAGNFAPRGALFIVKSEHLIGWKVFGDEAAHAEDSVREVFLPLANDSILSAAIRNQAIENGEQNSHADDQQFLDKLKFGASQNSVAIPLVVRGRGVASLYADGGEENKDVHLEALETLVRVASLTVELLAAAKSPATSSPRPLSTFTERPKPAREPETSQSYVSTPVVEAFAPSTGRNGNYNYQAPVSVEPEIEETSAQSVESDYRETYENFSQIPAPSIAPSVNEDPAPAVEQEPVSSVPQSFEQPSYQKRNDFIPSYQPEAESQPQKPTETYQQPPAARRFGERNVELPIDVPEEERRLHNDARRFARLLVSEIKLYNEQKVNEGRQAGDLYDRLREAVDRSREMYDKRVSPQVARKFDYFHYELVTTLAEGDESRLGADYPGSAV